MYASSRPQAQVVHWDPHELMILTWLTENVHHGAPPLQFA